ncbi:DUF3389 family protein [Vibrio sp. SCSIO 43136]|uniref:DUF3389 family protein n=1 Tax=Vibrio sp. SCSIO 43136 TaxID=2819101 RepID=UPI002074F56C|nr:DUF3389 family protein [Vibrio sp. SCSIO 43136]USD66770.1 DUF3389 domain-containing protein [Vibrio sp. SCSIO 43136]
MVIEFSAGKIIMNQFEIVVRLNGDLRLTMQAQLDALTIMGKGANMLIANDNEVKWSIRLDDELQLSKVAEHLGIAIQ